MPRAPFRCRTRRRRCSRWYADLAPDATLYDACAAPGGKAIALGRGVARVVAGDASRARIRRLAGNLRRAGSGREFAIVADALAPPVRPVDAVLLDAPCLGTGTFARHPDARWRVTPEALAVARRASRRRCSTTRPRPWRRAGCCSTARARSSPRRTRSRWSGSWRATPSSGGSRARPSPPP